MNKENEYVVICTSNHDCNNFLKDLYWVVELKDVKDGFLKDKKFDKGLPFSYKSEAERVCEWLNNELERKVDEKLHKMFHYGEIKIPFDFLDAWNNKCEEMIVERFDGFEYYPSFTVKCCFDSDLLVLSNLPPQLKDPIKICRILEIQYNTEFGASTFLCEDMILNVGKVREFMKNDKYTF